MQLENRHFQYHDTTHTCISMCGHYLKVVKLTFPLVYNFTGKQHRLHQNNIIYITSEIAYLVQKLTTHNVYFFRDYSPSNFDDFGIHFSSVCAFEWIKGNYKVDSVY